MATSPTGPMPPMPPMPSPEHAGIDVGQTRCPDLEDAAVSAVAALAAARVAGVRVRVDGADLVLEAPAAPPRPVLDALFCHKAEVVALLRPGEDGWSAEDWQAFFDERAGIAEHDGGMSRNEAEAQALECCVSGWLDRHPEPSSSGRCAWCEVAETAGSVVVPYGTQSHTWVHPECWAPWFQRRRGQAQAALIAMGIMPSTPDMEEAMSPQRARDGEHP